MSEVLPFKEGCDVFEVTPDEENYYSDDDITPMWRYPDEELLVRRDNYEFSKSELELASTRLLLLAELPYFNIPVVETSAAIGQDGKCYLVSDFIDGDSHEPEFYAQAPEQERSKANHLLDSLYDYLKYKIDIGNEFLEEIFTLEQYLHSEHSPHLTLVDTSGPISLQREHASYRFNDECFWIFFLVNEAVRTNQHDAIKTREWEERALELFQFSADRNGVVLTEEQRQKLTQISMKHDTNKAVLELRRCEQAILETEANTAYCMQQEVLIDREWADTAGQAELSEAI